VADGRLRAGLTLTRRNIGGGLGAAAMSLGAWRIAAAQATPPRATIRFADGASDTGWLGFAFGNEAVMLTVHVNGRPVQALLDNGASQTALDFRLAAALGLGHGDGVLVEGISGPAGAAVLQPILVQLGALSIALPTPIVLDLQKSGITQPMLLGREVFEHLIVDMDLPNRRMAFRQPGTFTPSPDMMTAPLVPQPSRARLTPIVLEGQAPVLAMFDLGSEEALAVSAAYAADQKLGVGRRAAQWVSGGVEGIEPIRITSLAEVRFGGALLKDVPVSVVDHWNRPESAVNIGMPLLSRFRLITDFGRDRMWLRADDRAIRSPFDRNRSGLACLPKGGAFLIVFVAPGSPGAAAGLHAGDVITAINGAAATPALRAWGSAAAGTTATLTLGDGSKRALTLADYF